MPEFILTSIQAPNQDFIARAVTRYLGGKLMLNTRFDDAAPWQERVRRLDQGGAQAAWICGLPYILRADQHPAAVELLAAPVMKGKRYHGRPVYFSDVLVRTDSPYQAFKDLENTVWAYNEPGSHSGYNVTRAYLAGIGRHHGFFKKVVAAGSHQNAVQMLLRGEIDAAAIDTTVLEIEVLHNPDILAMTRPIHTMGPGPAPPWVIARSVPQPLRHLVRGALLNMHRDPRGQALLKNTNISHFVKVTDADYDPIRLMYRQAQTTTW